MAILLDAWRHTGTRQRLFALAIPMILSNLSVPLVALVDSAVVGRLPHAYQLGAVAVGGSIYTMLVWTCGFLRMGSTGFAAQAAGRNDLQALRYILLQSLGLVLVLTLICVALALAFMPQVLVWMDTSGDLQVLAQEYVLIRLYGLPAALMMHVLAGWLLGIQNARAALWMLLTANSVNIVLDIYFVFGLHWEVAGAARASVLAEWSGALLGLFLAWRYVDKGPLLNFWQHILMWSNWRPLLSVNRDILIRSLALQGVFFTVTFQGARLGDSTVAANALLLNGLLLCSYALDGLAHALEALTGHALGQQDRRALRRALSLVSLYSLLAGLVFAVLFWLFGDLFIALQTNIPSVQATAENYLIYLALLPLITVWSYVMDGLFIGATRAREMRNSMLLAVLVCAPVAWLLQGLGNHGLWIAFLFFMALRAVFLGFTARHLSTWFQASA
ncbi:MATE family efflux transporter [Denitrificimonas sp. JX-1]|uniref:MATE family efflux transporter n=1 Tax=Denitrificimonas halotolerans TaxID=3098930 RepID=A0ABU5GT77_9GAMM|nr:MATE family efflux transporter [Denitrificimonas sp. JX-1]MDY7220190.1 MATE family efflux transporter [Denitrificimonas sp. JX-1]